MYRLEEGTVDHLADSGVQGFQASSHQANANWRGTKADIWEAGHRVPFLVRWPGKVSAGSEEATSICLTDVLATMAEIQETPLSSGQGGDSFSFLSLLEGKNAPEREAVIHHSVGGMFSLRQGKWKMVFGNGSGGRQQPRGKAFEEPYQLFDLENDPTESKDLIESEPEIAAQLTAELARIREANR
jgi:arylsulfatase A-like enzyme